MHNFFVYYLVLFILLYGLPCIAARFVYKCSILNVINSAYKYFKISWKSSKGRITKIIGTAWCLCFMFYVMELCLWQLVKIKGLEKLTVNFDTKSISSLNGFSMFMLLFICTVCAPAFFEEYIFRHVLFENVFKKSIAGGYIAGSIIFAVLHVNYNVFISKFLFGLLCCYIVTKTGSIMYTIVLHFINNLIALVISNYLAPLSLPRNKVRGSVSNIDFSGKVFLIFCICSFLLFCIVLFKYLKGLLQENAVNITDITLKQIED